MEKQCWQPTTQLDKFADEVLQGTLKKLCDACTQCGFVDWESSQQTLLPVIDVMLEGVSVMTGQPNHKGSILTRDEITAAKLAVQTNQRAPHLAYAYLAVSAAQSSLWSGDPYGAIRTLIKASESIARIATGESYRQSEMREMASIIGRKAVAQRPDQILRKNFISWCEEVISSGRGKNVRTIKDLLNIAGYSPEISTMPERTVKKWAREAGFEFQSGRPQEKQPCMSR